MSKMPRILVVDDEEAMRESLKDWLREDGYEVGLAGSGQEAVEMVREDRGSSCRGGAFTGHRAHHL